MRPAGLNNSSDGSLAASESTSTRDEYVGSRTPTRPAYIGKPPPGWKEPTRFIVGRRPPPGHDRHVQRICSRKPASRRQIQDVQPQRRHDTLSQTSADTLREKSTEIPFEENGPSCSGTSSRTLVDNNSSWRPLSPSRRTKSQRAHKYSPPCREILEDSSLEVYGETKVSDPSPTDIPVRVLQDFSIYDRKTKQLVAFEDLRHKMVSDHCDFGASGFVQTFLEEDEGTDNETDESDGDEISLPSSSSAAPPLRITLSPLLEISIHHANKDGLEDNNSENDDTTAFKLDERIYLRTEFAWYILTEPSPQYIDLYAPFHIKHKLFHELMVSCLAAASQEQDLSLEGFKGTLDALDTFTSQPKLSLAPIYLDCEDVALHLANTFAALCMEFPEYLDHLENISALATIRTLAYPPASSTPHARPARILQDLQSEAVGLINKTIVTPEVYEISKGIFYRKHLRQIMMEDDSPRTLNFQQIIAVPLEDAPQTGFKWTKEHELFPGHYLSVIFNGTRYNVGDTVLVEKGRDGNKRREMRAATLKIGDPLSDKYWFGKIAFMYEEPSKVPCRDGSVHKLPIPKFHVHWYHHGSKTILHDLAHPRQLFLTDECDSNDLDTIVQKCDVARLGFNRVPEPPDNFFAGVSWDQAHTAFREMSAEYRAALGACQPGEECGNCGLRQIRLEHEAWNVEDQVLRRGGVDFHIHDFVYLRPDTPAPALYMIGQIVKVDLRAKPGQSFRAGVRVYARYDAAANKDSDHENKDERLLVYTNHICAFDISRIEGKAYVAHLEALDAHDRDEWVKHDDHFLIKQRSLVDSPTTVSNLRPLPLRAFRYCQKCHSDRLEMLLEQQHLLKQHGPLRSMELFAGAGGLATGLHQSGFVKTEWAIEASSSAALSFAVNNPDCTVYNQCTNVMLRHAVETHYGRKPGPVHSRNPAQRGPLPPMPKPGEVDLISGGPPCQSFSGANHYKRDDDIRTTLVCGMVSYVEFYRPKYFLLENVVGMLSHKLGQKRDGVDETGMTVVKFLFRAMVALGYQAHCKVLQAAQYGAPQGRERVIFWGARRDVPLPDFPYPTHNYKHKSKSYDLLTGEILHRPVRFVSTIFDGKERDEYRQYAPFQAVTIQDAIGDLRKFDWANPHKVITQRRQEDVLEQKQRRRNGILLHPAVVDRGVSTSYSGFIHNESYLHPPLNRYQMQVRHGLDPDAGVYYHYTNRYTTRIVEQVVNVPLIPGANHANLPRPLRDARKFNDDGTSKRMYARHFGRLDANGQFRTTITTVKPNTMNGCVLHPTQKRVLTVRECARAQGFPDSYILESVQKVPGKIVEDQLRQIGNAVPIPLAVALGKELGKALTKMWKQEDQERGLSPEVPMDVDLESDLS